MQYILYSIIILFVGAYYAKTVKKLHEQEDRIIHLTAEVGRLKDRLEEESEVELTDYEKLIQQGVENLMGYSIEAAMKSKGDKR